jgi:hypothetical protein
VELGELLVEPSELVDDDAAKHRGGCGGVSVRHRDGHLRLLHELVVADERPDQHLLGGLVDDEVEALDEFGRGGLHASFDQSAGEGCDAGGRQSAMPQCDSEGDVRSTK